MKKIMMIAVMAVAAISANAQAWIGGNIGFTTNKTSVEGDKIDSNTTFEIAPEVGYNLDENWAVALKVAFSHNNNGAIDFAGETFGVGNTNTFKVNPYVRYTFVKAGSFSAFVDGGVSYATSHVSGMENNVNTFGVGFNPGIAYAISPKVSLVAHLGDLAYQNSSLKVGDVKFKNNAFKFDIFNGVSFGAYYAF